MKNPPDKSYSNKNLRQKAEDSVNEFPLISMASITDINELELIHETQVNQIKMNLQNEEMAEAQKTTQNAIDLYDFSPTGYFTLSKNGNIIGLNLSGAILLQKDRASLKGSLFETYVTNDSKLIFNTFLQNIFISKVKENCEITVFTNGNSLIDLKMTGISGKNEEVCLVTTIDTTELKQNETSLKQERELYQDIVNNQPAGIYRIRVYQPEKWWRHAWKNSENPPYQMEFVSDRFCDILGITREKFTTNPFIFHDFIYPEDKADFIRKNEKANNLVSTLEWVGRLVVDEKVIWIHLESIPRPFPNGEVLWTGILYEITDQKNNEKALKESEIKYRGLIDNSPDAISIYSEGIIVFVNNECLRLMGASKEEELLGKQVIEFIHPDSRKFAGERMKRVSKDFSIQPLSEEKFIRLDGTTVDVEVKSMPIIFQHKQAVQLIVRDITVQKEAENKLIASQQEFKDLFDNAPVGYHEIDKEGRIKRINQTELTMLGYTLNELPGQFVWKISANEAESKKATEDKLCGYTISNLSFGREFRRKNGTTFPVLVQDKILCDKEGKITGIRSTIQDITERKKAEIEINENREDFKDLFDNAPVGYHEIDSNGRIIRMNRTEIAMLGYSEEDIVGQYIWKFAYNESESKQEVKNKLKGQNIPLSSFESILISKNGYQFPILIQDKILRDINGKISGIRTTIQDISEIKKAEINLLLSEEKFRNIFENSIIGKSMTSIDGKILANKAFCQIVGYSTDELSRMHWANFTHKDDVETTKKEINAILNGEKIFSHWEKRYIHKNGNIVWVDISTFLQRDSAGNPMHFITEIIDITERKNTEKALLESEKLYRDFVLRIPDGVYTSTPEGKFIDVNPAMVNMLGYESKKELMSIDIKSQLYFDPSDRESLILNEKNEEIGIFQLKRKDGTGVWIEDHGWYNTDERGKVVTHEGVLRDINDRKRSEQALQESKVMLNKLLYYSTEFIDSKVDGIDYKKLTEIILEISGAKYTTFNILNENKLEYTTLAVSGLSIDLLKVNEIFGFEIINKTFRLDEVKHAKISKNTVTKFKGIRDLAENVLPVTLSKLIEKTFNIGETYVVKITKKDKIIGDFTLLFEKGFTLKNIEIVELFATQAGFFIDRDKADKKLRINEEKYRYLFDNNPQPMYIYDIDTLAFLEVNKAAIEHYEYSKEEFMSMSLKDIRPQEDIPAFLIDVQDKREKFKPAGVWRHKKKNGELIFVDITTVLVVSNGKNARHVMIQDITERKQAEDALKDSVSLLHATIDSTADGILVVDHSGKIALYNQKFVDMWNVPTELLAKKDDEPVLNLILSKVKNPDSFLKKVLFLYQHPQETGIDQVELSDGRILDRYSFPHKIGDHIGGRVWSFRDITLSKIAEEALRVSEEKFRSITEQIDDLIIINDVNGFVTYASPASIDFFQFAPEEMNGHHFMDFIHEDSLPVAIEAFKQGVNEKKKAINIELKLKRKDGSFFYGELDGTDFMNGETKGILVVLHDITKRKQTVELLIESEEKFRSIAEQTNDLITITDDRGYILYASPASVALFKMEPTEMLGHRFTDFLDESSAEMAINTFKKNLMVSKNTVNLELTMKQKDGNLFYGDVNSSNYNLGKGLYGKLVIIRDITERKKSQEILEEKINELMRFHDLTVDRELTMIQLKNEINELLRNSGQTDKYKIVQ